jgi:alpha-L-rhamnosidase
MRRSRNERAESIGRGGFEIAGRDDRARSRIAFSLLISLVYGIVFLFMNVARVSAAAAPNTGIAPAYLRCESLVAPIGIDEKAPRLSWTALSNERAQRQTAYRILVASTPEKLKEDRGDLWDSGVVKSDETNGIVYRGAPLVSHQFCYWKVRVWDKTGRESAWSNPAMWSMGMMNQSDWKASWIGCDKARKVVEPIAPLSDAKWIWFAGDKGPNAPKGVRVFLAESTIPHDDPIDRAELWVAGDDKYSFNINGRMIAQTQPIGDGPKTARRVDATSAVIPGLNTIRVQVENAIESPAGLIAKLTVRTKGGKTIVKTTDASWRATDQPGANWHNRAIDPASWPACKVVGDFGVAPWGELHYATLFLPPPPYLRTTFKIEKPVRHAVLYSTSLGIHDMVLNGPRVSEDLFNPGWTDYTKRVHYRAYDVTDRLRDGENALGSILGDGWYSGYIGWGQVRDHYGKKPRLKAQLHLEYMDGTTADITTGEGWKASTGAIVSADFLMGQSRDQRLHPDGWNLPRFDDSKWDPVDVGGEEMNPIIDRHPGPPVRSVYEFTPIKITEPSPKVYVFNLGRNFAGTARLAVNEPAGTRITLRFAERLNPDGTIYTANLRGARSEDTYICAGEGLEIWKPRFTFHGFQYVEVSGLTNPPTDETITGIAFSSDTPVVGAFSCSDSMINKLCGNIFWTQRANFIDIPTDCPQRDERLGWTGDAQVYVKAATLYADVQAFFTKWLVDLEDGQRKDGEFPMVAPVKIAGDDGGPAWADAGVICPWTIHQVYGDTRILERHYDSIAKFIAFTKNRCTADLLPPAQFHCFGDWLSIGADTPKDVIFMAYFARSARLAGEIAATLGKSADAKMYQELYEKIKASFRRAYVSPDGKIKGDTQAVYVLALTVDLLNENEARLAGERLVADIRAHGGHLTTGFIGTKDLMNTLSKIGRVDVAYRLLMNDTFPSWGFSIKQGATSIWERWDGWTPEKGFQDPGMNSFAHYSFGAVYQWIVENVAGIRSDGPGYKKIILDPRPGGPLVWAKGSYRSVRGMIESEWRIVGDNSNQRRFEYDVVIPANTTATVYIPADRATDVAEGGRPLGSAEGVRVVRQQNDRIVLEVGSGSYRFVSTKIPSTETAR